MTRLGSEPVRGGLALLRLRLVPSAMCDVLAGAALAGGVAAAPLGELLRTLACSGLLYGAGMALNDVADIAEDRRMQRSRPIVQGRITPVAAACLGLSMLAGGVLLAPAVLGPLPLLLAAGIVAYDFLVKRWTPIGAVMLGACRTANLMLGWVLITGELPPSDLGTWYPGVAYGGYTALAVVHGALEDRRPRDAASRAVLLAAAALPATVAFVLPQKTLAAAAAVPTLWLAARAPAAGPAWAGKRTGILLRGLSRFMFAVAIGVAAWLEAALIAVPAWVLPFVLRPRRWT